MHRNNYALKLNAGYETWSLAATEELHSVTVG